MKAYKLVHGLSFSSLLSGGKYRLKYLPGSVVEAVEGSVGLFCFTNLILLNRWYYNMKNISDPVYQKRHPTVVVTVMGEDPQEVGYVAKDTSEQGLEDWSSAPIYYRWSLDPFTVPAPEGTIAFKRLMVLDLPAPGSAEWLEQWEAQRFAQRSVQ